MRIAFPVVSLVMAASLLAVGAYPASAATGTFEYRAQIQGETEDRSLTDPADDVCINLEWTNDKVVNKTDKDATVFKYGDCSEQLAVVPAMGGTWWENDDFQSVRFG